jgi:hypothetical protein
MQEDDSNDAFEPDLDEGVEDEQLAEEARLASDRLTVLSIALTRHVEWREIAFPTIAADLRAMSRDVADDELRRHFEELENRGVLLWETRTDVDNEKIYDLDLGAARNELARVRA